MTYRSVTLTLEVGCGLTEAHARGQRAVIGWSAAEQDVIGHGLVQHGAPRAGVGRALSITAHALIRKGPIERPPR